MLYDLNIPWSPKTPQPVLERTLRFAKTLGYDVVALNQLIQAPMPSTIVNAIPQLTPPPASHPQPLRPPSPPPAAGTTAIATTTTTTSSSSSSSSRPAALPTTLRRATVLVVDPGITNYKLAEHARAYDLLAVRPTNDKAFAWACQGQDHAGIVSVDLAAQLGYYFAPRTCMAAVAKGIRFEVAYGQAIGGDGANGGGSARSRAQFISNVLGLLRATKGRGILVSSEARSALGLRAPADVVNLMAVWGLGPEKGLEALGTVPRSVVVNAGIQRRGFRGIVDIVRTAGPGPSAGSRDRIKGKDQQASLDLKRKKDADAGGGYGSGGQQSSLNKRQAKRMKRAAAQQVAAE
ncbi:hypothetical protein P8C59_002864 [Phyllachora maydis]|uniref:Uncharacterized protein n=1 Tax=Phyllachora maydis TaxID=1825666 RepID=A0AAD9MBV2_9PEZI|nr:hypothetical protein P8C59_002864 [Phyllachora maydis]